MPVLDCGSCAKSITGKNARFFASQPGRSSPAEISDFKPNGFRLYNMHGNAAEWVSDCWHTNLGEAPTTQAAWIERGDCSYRMTKGGSWTDGTYALRSAARGRQLQIIGSAGVGLRVVREIYTRLVQ